MEAGAGREHTHIYVYVWMYEYMYILHIYDCHLSVWLSVDFKNLSQVIVGLGSLKSVEEPGRMDTPIKLLHSVATVFLSQEPHLCFKVFTLLNEAHPFMESDLLYSNQSILIAGVNQIYKRNHLQDI